MNIEKEREAFEQHLTDTGLVEFAGYGFEVDECDEYTHEPTNVAWGTWQIGMNRAQAHEAKKLEGCVVVPEWISTKESLPAEGVEVLVHRYGQVIQATKDSGYAGGFKERNCYGWQATFDVTYWMPKNFKLPESYSFYYNDEHPYKVTMVEAARG
ncbi:hypothetical protein AWW72_03710 [Acinetobacter sp. NRRL B-65365]|uniref:DUF551 domain-containing protein n=1 Tax=Acinetobacter sp. NRRL B-65365 TaxID=1785092 RepID=UPI0007A08B9E|nr:DUF551 domain-containing protein [Acinetobacter sp. NRRL B-65365]KYQ80371.1 hypothetical protein AWW72_03710 [Acinetobacter sp. NRRL B-65365]